MLIETRLLLKMRRDLLSLLMERPMTYMCVYMYIHIQIWDYTIIIYAQCMWDDLTIIFQMKIYPWTINAWSWGHRVSRQNRDHSTLATGYATFKNQFLEKCNFGKEPLKLTHTNRGIFGFSLGALTWDLGQVNWGAGPFKFKLLQKKSMLIWGRF